MWRIIDILTGVSVVAISDDKALVSPLFGTADLAWDWMRARPFNPFRYRITDQPPAYVGVVQ